MRAITEAPEKEPRTSSEPLPAISVTGLRHRFGELEVLDGLDLAAAPGEVVGVVGPSGCGKSTLLELVAGLVEPSAGSLRVGGGEAPPPRPAPRGYMPQPDPLLPGLAA